MARTLRAVEAEGRGDTEGGPVPTEAEVIAALRQIEPLWENLFPGEQERIMKLLVEQVVVNSDGLVVRLRAEGLRSLASEMPSGTNVETEAKEVLV